MLCLSISCRAESSEQDNLGYDNIQLIDLNSTFDPLHREVKLHNRINCKGQAQGLGISSKKKFPFAHACASLKEMRTIRWRKHARPCR